MLTIFRSLCFQCYGVSLALKNVKKFQVSLVLIIIIFGPFHIGHRGRSAVPVVPWNTDLLLLGGSNSQPPCYKYWLCYTPYHHHDHIMVINTKYLHSTTLEERFYQECSSYLCTQPVKYSTGVLLIVTAFMKVLSSSLYWCTKSLGVAFPKSASPLVWVC